MTSTPDINVEIPEIDTERVTAMASNFWDMALAYTIMPTTWIPILMVIAALMIGGFTRKFLRPKLIKMIERKKFSYRIHVTLKNLTKLVLPLIALIIIALAEAVWIAFNPEVSLTILSSAAKLLIAWIIIRIIAQVIENNFVRQIVALFGWIVAALSILGVLNQTAVALDAIGMDFGDFRLSILTVVKFLIALGILLTVSRIIAGSVERGLQNTTDLTPSARVLLVKVIKVILVALAILIGFTTAGIDLSALAIFGGALGLGIGFGLQKVISNLFSGMLLLVDKSIKPGDIIEMRDNSGVFGWVSHLGARYVSVVTRDNKEYLIPNEDFITQPVINWSYTDRKIRVETSFGVDYASDPHLVKRLGVEVASGVKRVCADPKPVCHLVEFGDSSLNFVLRYWIEDAENGVTNTKGDVMLALWDAFQEHNIQIPFPHRVLIDKR